MSYHGAKQDQNAGAIVSALRAVGASCRFIEGSHGIKGVPDVLVGFRGVTVLLEIKGPRGRLSKEQEAFRASWCGGPLVTVRTPEEALAAVGLGNGL